MANTTIKITQLPSIGNGLSASTILPVVNTSGTAVTEKVTVGAVANYVLTQAGNTLSPAFLSTIAYSVSNASQPNITSVGTLSVDTLKISGGIVGYYLQTDGSGNLAWAPGGGGNGAVGGINTQVQFNDAGNFSGNTGFTFNKTTGIFSSPFLAGNGNGLSNIQGANVSGTVGNANLSQYLEVSDVNNNFSYHVVLSAGSGDKSLHIDADDNLQYNPADGTLTATRVDATYVLADLQFSDGYPAANVTGLGNIATANFDGNASNVLHGDGTWSADTTTYGNSNVVSLLSAFGSNTITTTGNVSVGNIIGNGQALTNIAGANVSGFVPNANVANTAFAVAAANVTGLGNIATINLTGSTSNVLYGNGVFAPASGGGGNVSELVNGNNSLVLDGDGNIVLEGTPSGNAINRGLVWDYGANANGVNSTLRQDNGGLILRAWTENGGGANGYSAPVSIVTNQDAAAKNWIFDGQGNLTVPSGSINSINDGGDLGAYITLTPDLGIAKLAARNAQSNVNYTNTSWTSGTYTGTQVDFVDAPDLVSFFNNNSFNDGVNQTFSINGGEPVPFTGYSIGASNAVTVYTDVTPEPDPTTVTSINFFSQFESYVSVDYDGGELNINATGLDIIIDNDQTEGTDIVLRSGDDISLQAKDMSVGSEREGGDINLNAGDGADDDGLGNTASGGGDIIIDAGVGGDGNSSSGGTGGFTQIRGGRGGTAGVTNLAGGGGYVEIAGGDGGFNNSNTALGASGGDVNIYGGDTTREGFNGASVYLTSGAGGPNAFAGSVNISTPSSDEGPGGLWQFDGNGLLTLPDGAIIDTIGNNFEVRAVENVNFEANAVVNIYTDGSNNAYQWQFGDDGNLTLPGNTFAVNYANGSPVVISGGGGNTGNVTFDDNIVIGTGDEYGGAGLYLATGPNGVANLQYLRLRGGDNPTHIHLDTGNNQAYDQYFGDDAKYVKLELGDTGNVVVGTDDAAGNSYNWTFTSGGNFILANGNSVIQSIANSSLDPTLPNVSTMTLTPDANYNSQVLVLDPTAPGHIHLRAYAFSNIDEPAANIFLGGEDTAFEITSGANNQAVIHSNGKAWTFGNDGNISSDTLTFTTTFANVKTVEYQTAGVLDLYVEDGITGSNTAISRLNVSFKDNLIDKPQVYIENTKESDGIALRWTFDENGNLNFPRDVAGNTDPYLNIFGGSTPTIQSTDVSLAGPANLAIQSDYLNLSGFTGNRIILHADAGGIATDANIVLSTNLADLGNVYSWTLDTTGNLTLPGNTFAINYANGAQVSLGGGGGAVISNGTSYANVVSSDGNVVIGVDGDNMTWTFATDRKIYGLIDEDITIVAIEDGAGVGVRQVVVDNALNDLSRTRLEESDFYIQFDLDGSAKSWRFDNGSLRPPTNGAFEQFDGNIRMYAMNAGSNPVASLQSVSNQNDPNIFTTIDATTTGANISVYNGGSNSGVGYTWRFDNNGLLTLPNSNVQIGSQYGSQAILANDEPFGVVSQGANGFTILQWSDDISNTSQLSAIYVNAPLANAGDIHIKTGNVSSPNVWAFNSDGNLTLPTGGQIIVSGGLVSSGASPAPSINGFSIINSVGISGNGNIAGNNISATGNVSGNFFLGNGSQLTGITATSLVNGTSNVVTTSNGNVTIGIAGNAAIATFTGTGANVTGTLNITGNVTAQGVGTNLVRRANTISGSNTVVTLDNLTALVGGSPTRLYIGAASSNMTMAGTSQTMVSGSMAVSSWINLPISTGVGNGFAVGGAISSAGDTVVLNITDQGAGSGTWRVTGIIANTSANLYSVSIERLA